MNGVAIEPTGLTCVAEPSPGAKNVVNVVFVHGLNGHPRNTWSYGARAPPSPLLSPAALPSPTLPASSPSLPSLSPSLSPSTSLSSPPSSPEPNKKRFRFFKSLRSTSSPKVGALEPSIVPDYGLAHSPSYSSATSLPAATPGLVFWPAEHLPSAIPSARVWTYGYNAGVISGFFQRSHKNNISQHGNDMMVKLERGLQNKDPIIFVAHSLGGLVVKRAVLMMQQSPLDDYQTFLGRVRAIVFCGTPHRGSDSASLALKVSKFGRGLVTANSTLLRDLEVDTQVLSDLHLEFIKLLDRSRIDIHSFQEGLAMQLPLSSKVVSDSSSAVEWGKEAREFIQGDHRTMVRSEGMHDITAAVGKLARKAAYHSPSEAPKQPVVKEGPIAEVQDCLWALAFPEMDNRAKNVVKAANGTCDWILSNPEYTDWLAGRRESPLWIQGKPGAGKSTVLKHALANFTESHRDDKSQVILSYFCHGRGTELQKSALGFYRTLLHQLLCKFPDQMSDLVESFTQRQATLGKCGDRWNWQVEDLKSFVWSCLPRILETHSVSIFVDALDECGQDEAAPLVQDFEDLSRDLQGASGQSSYSLFRLCFSCRHYPILSLNYGSTICVEHFNQSDILTYVNAELYRAPDETRAKLVPAVSARASGIFIWAHLVVEKIRNLLMRSFPVQAILDEIEKTPKKLNDLYTEIIQSSTEAHTTLRVFQWVLFSLRPLRLDELRWALAIEPDPGPQRSLQQLKRGQHYIDDDSHLKQRINVLSCGLVEAVPSVGDGNEARDGDAFEQDILELERKAFTVQFIHQSVKDFLLSTQPAQSAIADALQPAVAHRSISRTCARYLNTEEVLAEINACMEAAFDLLGPLAQTRCPSEHQPVYPWPANPVLKRFYSHDFAFAPYALGACFTQAKLGETGRREDSIDFLECLGGPQAPIVSGWAFSAGELWNRAYWLEDDVRRRIRGELSWLRVAFPADASLLHIAAASDMIDLVRLLIERGLTIDAKARFGWTPLHVAFINGCCGAVRTLLELGATCDTTGPDPRPLLHQAVDRTWYGHRVTRGSHEDVRKRMWDSIELLVQHGARVDSTDEQDGTPLHILARSGWDRWVVPRAFDLLLDKGADISWRDARGRTPIFRVNSVRALEMLLQRGARLDERDNQGHTVLSNMRWHTLRRVEHNDIIRYLVKLGVDLDSRDPEGRTVLCGWFAPKMWHSVHMSKEAGERAVWGKPYAEKYAELRIEVVSFLVELGADIDAADDQGRTALHHAVRELVSLLGEEGAQVQEDAENPKDPDAERESVLKVVKFLVEFGADLDWADADGATPLSLLAGHPLISDELEKLEESSRCGSSSACSSP